MGLKTRILGAFAGFVLFLGCGAPQLLAAGPPRPSQAEFTFGPMLRSVHIGGNWWTNTCFSQGGFECPSNDMQQGQISQEFIDHLKGLQVNWVGISVALFLDDVSDASVGPKYAGDTILTWTDAQLRQLIQRFHGEGFNVYVTLAFEDSVADAETVRAARCGQDNYPAPRWQFGGHNQHLLDSCIAEAHWRWNPDHLEHASYISEFWSTYTAWAVHFGAILEEEGVALYSLGTETDRIFRSRPGTDPSGDSGAPNHFRAELRNMLAAVRAVYNGLVTYDQVYEVLVLPTVFGPGTAHLWEDVDYDVIGISAYYRLADSAPTSPLPKDVLKERWRTVFNDFLKPLKSWNPTKAIVFTEFGYTHSVRSPFDVFAEEFDPYVFTDDNSNGLDDGEETQANIYETFFDISRENPGIVKGAFVWGAHLATELGWQNSYLLLRSISFRGRLAENVVRNNYANPIPQPAASSVVSPSAIISILNYLLQ